jgi:pyruvate formate lyase activating enzyme
VKNCIPQALRISGKKMTVDEVFKVVKKDADYYEASGGGVTASGGEIISQADFVAALFRKCREAGFHTNADTSGYGDPAGLEKILEYSDLVYYDLKHLDPVKPQEYTANPTS